MDIIKFNFDSVKARELRRAINDQEKFSIERVADGAKGTNGAYNAWNRLCATMTRLEDTISYVNCMELGKLGDGQAAFDFYEFINCSYVIIECIKVVIQVFGLDKSIIKNIEDSTEVFGTKYSESGSDSKLFEYILSLCGVHPLCTSYQKDYLNGSAFHCCPFVAWADRGYVSSRKHNGADLIANVYTTKSDISIDIELYLNEFETYLNKWIECIPNVIGAKNKYVDDKHNVFRKEQMKNLSDFRNDYIEYISYLKEEYIKRLDDANEYILDEFIEIFKIKLSNSDNQRKLDKYKNAILYSLGFLHNSLQTMTFTDFENTGIKYPDKFMETELYIELASPTLYNGEFAKYSYAIGKAYNLSSNGSSNAFDKHYARTLLEKPKELINKYILFTNQESNEEVYVLIKVALYLESLTRKSILNKNIPNEEQYREILLTETEVGELHQEEPEKEVQPIDLSIFNDIIKEYGG